MIVESRSDRDFDVAVAKMVDGGAGAMIVSALAFRNLDKVVSLAALHKLPAIYPFRNDTSAGGLLAYAPDSLDQNRRAASYVDRLLRGAKVSELPVQFPTKFELIVNLKTAKSIGLDIPAELIARADKVIE